MIRQNESELICDKCEIKSVPTFFIMNGKDLLGSCNGANKENIGLQNQKSAHLRLINIDPNHQNLLSYQDHREF